MSAVVDDNCEFNGLESIFKGPRMTKEFIKKHCKEQKLYQTPRLNDVLYLHFKGFSYIENLEEYTGLKCLWLENNGLRKISGLDHQTGLRSLFLHYNLIKKIENLEKCALLDTLNLASNQVKKIENLACIKSLHTLNLANNYVECYEDFEHLEHLLELSVLDLANNHVEDPLIVQILGNMPGLRVLNLMGNPVTRKIPAYRKTLILACKNLQYLDDRPVFPRERACAEAWKRGGITEEHAERKRWIDAERQKIMDSVNALIAMRDRRRNEADVLNQNHDSGFATSIGDSESEAESLHNLPSETKRGIEEEEEEEEEEKDEIRSNEEVTYNYAQACIEEDETEESESSSESEDDFMSDHQTEENYSAYSTRIFDFSRKGDDNGRVPICKQNLIEEIQESQSCCKSDLEPLISEDENAILSLKDKNSQTLTENLPNEPKKGIENTECDNGEDKEKEQELLKDISIDSKKLAENNMLSITKDTTEKNSDEIFKCVAIELPENEEVATSTSTVSAGITKEFVEDCTLIKQENPGTTIKTYEECVTSRSTYLSTVPDEILELSENTACAFTTQSLIIDDNPITLCNNSCQTDNQIIDVSICQSTSTEKGDITVETVIDNQKCLFTLFKNQINIENIDDSDNSEDNNDNLQFESCCGVEEFINKLDKSEEIKATITEIGEGDFIIKPKSREELRAALCSSKGWETIDEDKSYRELLEWDIAMPKDNFMILQPIERHSKNDKTCSKSELCEMIENTKTKDDLIEFHIKPSEGIADEGDKIMYATGAEPQLIYKAKLQLSNNRTIFERRDGEVVKNEDVNKVVSSTIAEVRQGMKEFNRQFDEFNEKSQLAKEKLLKEYNDALETERKVVDKFMSMQECQMEKRMVSIRKEEPPVEITDEYLEKHFDKTGMICSNDSIKKIENRNDFISENVKTGQLFLEQLETLKKMVEQEEQDQVTKENREELAITKRTIACSLEMQLAQDNENN
ncbi:hypothetical protein ABEB36_007259 [Hypothenemus hampei]|uniref:Dynein axonemal assembly factor 1 homolog n=1 Tax=Hypothenemus hampei TaxID=57062 RepID=A0ABD1EXC0_HYPHA